MDVVVFAELVKAAEPPSDLRDASTVTRADFRIVEVLKGGDYAEVGSTLSTIYLGDAKPGDRFLVQGVRPPDIAWSTPMRVSDRGMRYLVSLSSVPDKGAERLEFFLSYLEDDDEMLARDAYDEFARAPYEDVIALKASINHDKLLTWLLDPEVSASRKRLYYTLLGVCGSEADLPTLERLMRSTDRQEKAGLDAMIACYLTIRGDEGLSVIEQIFLGNPEADYSDTYSAITALRFHGTDGNVIDRQKIVKSLGLMLDRPALADLVIPDLARWEDWSVMERLVEMFKTADEKTSWIRVPVVNYLRACPLPEAKTHLEELGKLDPDAIRRANTFFPIIDESDLDDESDDDSNEPAQENNEAGDGNAGDGGVVETNRGSPNATISRQTSSAELAMSALAAADPTLLLVTAPATSPRPEVEIEPAVAQEENESRASIEATETKFAPAAQSSGQMLGSDSNLPSSRGVAILGAWSDSARFVAAQSPSNRPTPPLRAPSVVASTGNSTASLILMGLVSIIALTLALLAQWYVLTGRLAKAVN